MNTQLKTLFKVYKISDKDQHEINQIFALLPAEKRINFLNNFPVLAGNLQKIHDNIEIEKKILLGEGIQKINQAIDYVKQQKLKQI